MNLKDFNIEGLSTFWEASGCEQSLKMQIATELEHKIISNTSFSKEYLFNLFEIQKTSIVVEFIPTTESYKNYGSNVCIDLLLTEIEKIELLRNMSNDPPINTNGQIRAKMIDINLSEKQNNKEIVFHTNEIRRIHYARI